MQENLSADIATMTDSHDEIRGERHFRIIKPYSGWGSLELRELWEYRDLIYFMLWREIKGRYQQMALGPLWIIITPLVAMLTNTAIFNGIADIQTGEIPYPLFNYSALLIWGLFSTSLLNTAGSLVSNKELLAKVYFPRLIIPMVAVMANVVDFFFSFIILIIMMLLYGFTLQGTILLIPLIVFFSAMTGLGLGLWLASWIVKYRDIGNFLGHGLQFARYASPIVYPISAITDILPATWLTIYKLNPMTGIVETFRWALLGVGDAPDWTFFVSMGIVIVIVITGAFYFRRTEHSIVDIA